jgi:hypothetical protein
MKPIFAFAFVASLAFGQLRGLVDVHTHGDPDSAARKIDVLELAQLAKKEGMRAIVLKNHYTPTVQAAYLVAKLVPEVEIFGAIALNRSVGGVNPAAVEQAVAMKGNKLKIVWMPTFDSENNVRFTKENRPFVPVAKNNQLLPEVEQVLQIIAKNQLVLATGHSSAAEDLMLVREAKKLGIQQVIVTHPLYAPIHMSIPEMQELAKLGVYLELCGNAILPMAVDGKIPVEEYTKAIRAVGVDHMILSSDLGQAVNPVHTEGWKIILDVMRKQGFTQAELDTMTKSNPAKLLGLKP